MQMGEMKGEEGAGGALIHEPKNPKDTKPFQEKTYSARSDGFMFNVQVIYSYGFSFGVVSYF